jgi:hypothetical protein
MIKALAGYLAKSSDFPNFSHNNVYHATPSPPSRRPSFDSDAKDDVVEVTPPTSKAQPTKTPTQTPKKHPRQPKPSPPTTTTPSPDAKRSKPTVIPTPKSMKPLPTDTGGMKAAQREIDLQKKARAVGADFTVTSEHERQWRLFTPSEKRWEQCTHQTDHECDLFIETWRNRKDSRCQRCSATVRRDKWGKDDLAVWRCDPCGFDICFTCIPIILRTPAYELIEEKT